MMARHARDGACNGSTMSGEGIHAPERRRPERSIRARGLPACFEAARVSKEAKVFHERVHDTINIALLPANASLRAAQALARRG
jgi:hypothetical protein